MRTPDQWRKGIRLTLSGKVRPSALVKEAEKEIKERGLTTGNYPVHLPNKFRHRKKTTDKDKDV